MDNLTLLKYDLLKGSFGDDFISEALVAQRYDIKKSAARELLLTLTHQGLLNVIPRCGYRLVSHTYREYLDMVKIRLEIEKLCILEALKRSPLDTTRLRKIWENSFDISQDFDRYLSNREFHAEIVRLSGLDYARVILNDIEDKTGRFF